MWISRTNNEERKKLPFSGDQKLISQIIIFLALAITVIDSVYMSINGIHQQNRELCILYSSMPRWLFLCYEYFFEFAVVVLLGVFAGVLIDQYFRKIKRFFPGNQLLAFLYGSLLPVCSCGVIPIVESMKERVKLRVIITFVIAAPLLNPYIVFLSFSVLGLKYGILRIITSFLLAILVGLLTEFMVRKSDAGNLGRMQVCTENCSGYGNDPFVKTVQMTRKLLPYIFWGGLLSFSLEYLQPKAFLQTMSFSDEWLSMLTMTIVGVPIYVCNGADVLLLKPLLAYTDLTTGTAMVFSLTSSAVCISSIAMLFKFMGRKLTLILLANLIVITLIIGFAINHMPAIL
jgi:hypothetical protein